jgi:hypothetical protein
MKPRRSASVAVIAGVLLGAVAYAQAPVQAPEAWTHRTADGQPDLRGTWVNFDSTPFESDTTGPLGVIPNVNPPAHWADHDSPMSPTRRSMVVDPPDGRVPVQKWAEDKRDYDLAHLEDHYKHETAWVRCITRGVPGGMFPAGYNNAYEIEQIPGYVVIVYEMIHDTRVIPLDGRPHVGPAFGSGTAIRAATSKATRSSSRRRTLTPWARSRRAPRRGACAASRTARSCTSSSASRASARTSSTIR